MPVTKKSDNKHSGLKKKKKQTNPPSVRKDREKGRRVKE